MTKGKDLFQLLLIIIICSFVYFVFLFLFLEIFVGDSTVYSTAAFGSFFGAFFAFLFLRIGDFFIKLYKNKEEHFNGLTLLNRILNKNIFIANNNIFFAGLIIVNLQKGEKPINTLSKFILVDEVVDKIKNLDFFSDVFSLSINLKEQNDNIEMINDFCKGMKSSSIEENDVEKNYRVRVIKCLENFEKIYEVYQKFESDRDWIPTLKEEMARHHIFTAYYKDRLISAVTCYQHDGILRIARIFSARLEEDSDFDKRFVGYASRRVFFEVCKYGQANGYKKFDLSGVNFDDPTKAGLTRFKQSFGGPITDVYVCKYMTKDFRDFREKLKANKIDIT